LTSPVYCSKNATCCISPNQQTDNDIIIEASFGIAFMQKDFKGVLLYKLEKKYPAKTKNLLNDTETNTYLLVFWDVKNEHSHFYVCLLEYTSDFTWDEDKLWALHHQHNDQFYNTYNGRTITWLTHDGTFMRTKLDIKYGSDYKLDIVISEGTGTYNTFSPVQFDPKRLVLPYQC
jgi:hypothetical protein